MGHQLSISERAEDDYRRMYDYIRKRSVAGASRWEEAFEEGILRVLDNPFIFERAQEGKRLDIELRQLLFGTKQGLIYRAVFTVERDTVYILRFRGPGQRPLKSSELKP